MAMHPSCALEGSAASESGEVPLTLITPSEFGIKKDKAPKVRNRDMSGKVVSSRFLRPKVSMV